MKAWFYAFFMAWGMFLALPCPFPKWDEDSRGRMLVCLPLVGVIVGGLWALIAWLVNLIRLPAPLTALLLAALPWAVTGFIHLDGFTDVCDAMLSRRPLEERRRILKDPHAGAFGVICLVLLMLAQFAVFLSAKKAATVDPGALLTGIGTDKLSEMLSKPAAPSVRYGLIPMPKLAFLLSLALIPVASRAAAGLAVLKLRPMQTSQYAGMANAGRPVRGHILALIIMLVLAAAVPAVLFGLSGLAPAVTGAAYFLFCLIGYKNLKGMNGDISGFALSLGELFGAAALVLLSAGTL